MNYGKFRIVEWIACLGLVCGAMLAAAQETPSVNVVPEKSEVFVGEPFILQIQLENAREANPPDLATLLADDFNVVYGGGQQNNSQSVSYVNGRTTRVVSRQYLMNFQLTAKRPGQFQIPAFDVMVGGQNLRTQALQIRAVPPEPVKDFKLKTELSKTTCYVGEPIAMTTTYYIGGQVRNISFSLPVLSESGFQAEPFAIQQESNKEYYQIQVNGEEVIAEKGDARLDNRQFITLSFQHILVPNTEGKLTVQAATASGEALSGQRRGSSPFSIFDSRDQYKTVIVPSESIELTVLPVPDAGRPANFSGLVGNFSISASASPTEVKVGDPITLTVRLEGSRYLRHFELPPLQTQAPLAERFRIPEEMAPGRVEGSQKIFTQTIRAVSADVTEIPPIALAFFEPSSGNYKTIETRPIPLVVEETQVITAVDAEGYQRQVNTVEHVAVDQGIAHNFTEPEVLRPQHFGPDVWMRSTGSWLLLLLPPLAYAILAGALLLRRLGGPHPGKRNRKQARAQMEATLADTEEPTHGKTLQALRVYLGAKLNVNGNTLTCAEVETPLRAQGASDQSLHELRGIFEACEAQHYAGGSAPAGDIVARVLACVETLDKEIG